MRAADVLASLEEARRAVAAGDLVDLAGLEKAVEALCGEALGVPAETRTAAAGDLDALRQALDRLAKEIEASKTSAQAGAQRRSRAAKAYRS